MKDTRYPHLISVILPVFSNAQYVKESIRSILDQTYQNIELLILISASADKETIDVISTFDDYRIRHIHRKQNDNLPSALNLGIKESKGKYIARMDSDDISLPERLETQYLFMEKHPKIGLCGSWYQSFGDGKNFINKLYTKHEDICASLLFNTSFAHPSVILRKKLFADFKLEYDENLHYSEDYDLWSKCTDFFHVANIGKVLLRYRIHDKSASHVFKKETSDVAINIRLRLLRKVGLEPFLEEIHIHNSLLPKENESIKSFLEKEDIWLSKILLQNTNSNIYNVYSLNKIIYKRWRTICGFNTQQGLNTWQTFQSSQLYKIGKGNKFIDGAKIFLKCLLKK